MKRPVLFAAAALAATGAGAAIAQTDNGVIGPQNRIQPSGRKLAPVGRLTNVGNHPGGAALTPSGRFLWTLSAGRGRNDIRIVAADPALGCKSGAAGAKCRKKVAGKTGKVIQTIPMPGLSGGVAMAPDGRTAYVSGLPDSSHADERAPAGTPGLAGDVIHVFRFDPATGLATRDGTIPVPPPPDAPSVQNFPPTPTKKLSWPRDLAVSRDGGTLLAALNLADAAAVIDTKTRKVSYVKVGGYPYGAAIARNGKGLISNEADGTVSVIDLASKQKLGDVQVGPALSHPEGIATDPAADRAYVAVAHQDLIAVLDTNTLKVQRTLSVERPQGIGTEPTQLSVTRDGCRLLSADSGEDAVAVFALKNGCDTPRAKPARKPRATKRPRGGRRGARRRGPRFTGKLAAAQATRAFQLIGRVPVGSYPVYAGASPGRQDLDWVAAKGLGVGPNPNGPDPLSPNDTDDKINSFGYLPSIVSGVSGSARFPTDAELRADSRTADKQVKPSNAEQAPAGTPIRPGGPIKHVFYFVRENRTYDQIFGDDSRGNGDPKLALFGKSLTPNAHALAQRFPLLDHVYANSEASIDGHFWTSASAVSDYVVKNWHQNYAGRQRPYDFGVYSITFPAKRFLFDQAEKQGISYFNYGEAIAGTVPLGDRNRPPDETAKVLGKFAKSDLGTPPPNCYPNDASIGKDAITGQEAFDSTVPAGAPPGSESRFDCFKQRFTLQLATNSAPAFNYFSLPSDHTEGLSPGRRTPQAMIAENDYALGQFVDLISHSPVWSSSMIVVLEDDSQDGADHVDAHRIPALAISPYAKPGAVVHTRYDFPSLIRTIELPIGMQPLNLFDSLAVPLYDAFDPSPNNAQPFSAIAPSVDLNQRNPSTPMTRRLSRGLNLHQPDRVTQRTLDGILWRAVHGAHAKPPPPGPNAVGEKPGDG